ncbi:hypothetical protein P8452_46389 [Trifolium repens]|nr:hypothetical protein P8452_46389 [Trifolium repens]
MGDGTIQENHKSLAAPSIFFIVAAFQLAYYYLDDMNKAARLKRLAAAKEKELAKYQSLHKKDMVLYLKAILVGKYLTYGMLLIWFWRVPVASISQQLVQPFGRLLSWKTGIVQDKNIVVGIIAWLIVSARVCRYVRRACSKLS